MTHPPAESPVRLCVALGGVFCADQLLLIQRGKPPYRGLWGLPGGKIESRESPLDALRREIREECGLRIDDARRLGMLYERLDEADGRTFLFDLHLFRAELDRTPAPLAGGEGRVAFHPLARLDDHPMDYIPTDLLIVRHILRPAVRADHETWVVRDGDRYLVRHFRPRREL